MLCSSQIMDKAPKHQYSLQLIERKIQESIIQQRSADGYINASALCAAAGKHWYQYRREESSGHFLRALSAQLGIPEAELYPETMAREDGTRDVWVHPQVAINLAQWLSGEFAARVSQWVYEWMSGKAAPRDPAKLPYHLERHMLNYQKVPATHFSILQEMTLTLIAPLESQGYTLPEDMVPDISQGLMFCNFLRKELGLDTKILPTYEHEFPDGRVVDAKLYPIEHLGAFRQFIHKVWMPERAERYFKERDPQALPLLDRILRIGNEPPRLPSGAAGRKRRRSA